MKRSHDFGIPLIFRHGWTNDAQVVARQLRRPDCERKASHEDQRERTRQKHQHKSLPEVDIANWCPML